MFEQPTVRSEKDRSQTIMILSGVAVLAVIVLIIMVTSFGRRPAQTEVVRAGTPEYDSYASSITISNIDTRTGERLNTKYARILCTVQNTGERTLAALQLRAAVIGFGGQLLREKIITPVPNNRDSLGSSQAMNIDVSLEPVPDPSEIMTMTIELHGLKLK